MLNYKKPAFGVIVVTVIACAVVMVCFATNPKEDVPLEQHMPSNDVLMEKYPEYFDGAIYKN